MWLMVQSTGYALGDLDIQTTAPWHLNKKLCQLSNQYNALIMPVPGTVILLAKSDAQWACQTAQQGHCQ